MLEPLQIMSGFKQIRSELHAKRKLNKKLSELALWFTCEKEILYVHDMEDHQKYIAIAFRNQDIWVIWLHVGSPGELLVREAVGVNPANPNIFLNEEYNLGDFVPPRFF